MRRFEVVKLRSSRRGGEVNLCEDGEEGKKSNTFESSEHRSGERSDMVVDQRRRVISAMTASYNVQITCFRYSYSASRDIQLIDWGTKCTVLTFRLSPTNG